MMIRRSFREFTYLSSCILQQDHAKQSLRRLGFVNLEYLNSRQETCIDALPVSAVPAVPITRYDTVPVPGTTALPSTIAFVVTVTVASVTSAGTVTVMVGGGLTYHDFFFSFFDLAE